MSETIQVTASAEDANIQLPTEDTQAQEIISQITGSEPGESTGITINTGDSAGTPQDPPAPEAFEMPEKFQGKSAEEIAKSYLELEKMKAVGTEEVPATGQEAEQIIEQAAEETQAEATETAEFSIDTYSQKWAENGSLEESDWETIQKNTNLPMEKLKEYEALVLAKNASTIAQAEDIVSSQDTTIYNAAGGQDSYDRMIDWAGKNMSPVEVTTLNAMLDNPDTAEGGALMLKSRYESVVGTEPQVTPQAVANSDITGVGEFANDAEMLEAMQDPKYHTSETFRRDFDEKLIRFMKRSNQL